MLRFKHLIFISFIRCFSHIWSQIDCLFLLQNVDFIKGFGGLGKCSPGDFLGEPHTGIPCKSNVLGEKHLGSANPPKPIVKVMIWEGLGVCAPLGTPWSQKQKTRCFYNGFWGVCAPEVFSPGTLL